jgi:hypothetical protein
MTLGEIVSSTGLIGYHMARSPPGTLPNMFLELSTESRIDRSRREIVFFSLYLIFCLSVLSIPDTVLLVPQIPAEETVSTVLTIKEKSRVRATLAHQSIGHLETVKTIHEIRASLARIGVDTIATITELYRSMRVIGILRLQHIVCQIAAL